MTDHSGETLLHYRLTEKIGKGGMGEVYRARDTSLDRDVAIKVLPAGLADDAERIARFEREAKLLAALNHPNIASIYGFHEAQGTRFLAMEMVEGEDLADRLRRGALPRDEVLDVAHQIAQALESAHEAGVVHRDLKPANIKRTEDGMVKVLDLGLAKAMSPDASMSGAEPSMSPTLTSAGTMAGVILGTAAYMSPEQAKGKAVDRRADIWSFGVVLYEMLTGRRMFEGETISETLAAVLLKELDFDALPPDTPPRLRRLLQRCFQRDPKSRLRDMGDARIAIEETQAAPDEVLHEAIGGANQPMWLTALPWVLMVATLGWSFFAGRGDDAPPQVMRFTMSIADDQPLDDPPVPMIAISPDGTRIVYVGVHDDEDVLFLRHIHQHEATLLKGTKDADSPFFSPDGQWIGFASDGKLKKISVLGGPPATLCDAPRMRGATWGEDGTIVFAPDRGGGLSRVSEAGGEPEILTLDGSDDSMGAPSDRWPQFLPGGQTVIYTSTDQNSEYVDANIEALDLADGSTTTLIEGGNFGRYVHPGFLVYARDRTLFAARFDPARVEVSGPAVPVLEDVSGVATYGSKFMTFSETGTLLYLAGSRDHEQETLLWIDRDGVESLASAHERNYSDLALSPDGTRVALDTNPDPDEFPDIWILEFERDTMTRLTFDDAWDIGPVWSPDGQWITFASDRHDEGEDDLYRKRSNGTGDAEQLTSSETTQLPRSWTPDGATLAFVDFSGGDELDIKMYRPDADPEIATFLATPFEEWEPYISPDGKWIAYGSDQTGQEEVYVRPLDGDGEEVRISTDGGLFAKWNPVDQELILRARSEVLQSVPYTVENGRFRPALPQDLFDLPNPPYGFDFAVSPDGQRFLAHKDIDSDSGPREPWVIVNWNAELDAKVPK